MKIFSGNSNLPLAEKIAEKLNTKLSSLEIHVFSDGEQRIRVIEKVVDEDCVVVQSTSAPVDENYMELFFIIDALKRSGAKSVTAVVPYLGYQRQDHVFRDGEAVSLEVVAKTLESVGADKIITFDLHSIKIPEVFNITISHLSALSIFAEKIKQIDGSDMVLVSPDEGGIRRIKLLSAMLGNMPVAVINKDRDLATGKVTSDGIIGNVKNKTVFILDDMISTGGTLKMASKLLKKKGAGKIFVFVTHAVLSGDFKNNLSSPEIEKVFTADTIFVPDDKIFPKLEILSVAEMIADSLK